MSLGDKLRGVLEEAHELRKTNEDSLVLEGLLAMLEAVIPELEQHLEGGGCS
jgi:hypothetical protein